MISLLPLNQLAPFIKDTTTIQSVGEYTQIWGVAAMTVVSRQSNATDVINIRNNNYSTETRQE